MGDGPCVHGVTFMRDCPRCASDSHNPPDARVRKADLTVRREWPTIGAYWAEVIERPAALRAENERLREALNTAADDLDKAANQFEGIRQAQKAGHEVQVVSNSRVFAAKAQRAREALEAGER